MMKIEGSGSESGSISQRHGSVDPYPHQNVMDPQHCFAGLGRGALCSVPEVAVQPVMRRVPPRHQGQRPRTPGTPPQQGK
jgi:hypothetical protein